MSRPGLIAALVIFLLMNSFVATAAQDEVPAEVTPEVTEEAAERPAPEVTETIAPTDEPITVPTEAAPEVTEESQQGETPEASEEPAQTTEPDLPTPVSAPPVFEIGSTWRADAGQPLDIPFSVYDEQGAVVITQIVSAVGAQTALAIVAPVQDSPPYATTGTIHYTAPAAFSGTDTLTLIAVDGAGTSATAIVQIDVQPVVEVAEEATQEATPAVTPEATEAFLAAVERIISYDPAASEESIQAMLAALQATEISRIPPIGAMKVLVPEALASPARAMAALQGNQAAVMAGVTAIEENIFYQLDFTPNDPQYNNGTAQWPLRNFVGSMWTFAAWDLARQDGAGVLVAVLDSGVDLQHPDLAGQIDTAKGWDFINDDNDPDDDHLPPPPNIGGHGTHVAGIIAAKTNNSLFMAGVAFKAKIIPVKVCTPSDGCPTYEIAAGIVHAVDKGAHIINLSLSSPAISTTVQGAVQYALARNVTVIASAGNSGNNALQYPAAYPGVISVASHDINGNISPSSTHNDSVAISAPGVSLFSLARTDWPGGNGGAIWSGTSAAAAHVSGVAALLYADNIARTPALIREALICSAWDRGAVGYDEFFGYGLVQSDYALNFRAASTGQENSPNCKITQPNDLIQNATEIKKVPFSVTQPVHTRSVTSDSNDPADCFTPSQTLWYRFVAPANERYQITSYGSTYNTVLAVYQGVPGNLTMRACAGAWFDPGAFVTVDMQKGQTYYIVLMPFSAGGINDQIAQLDIRPAMSTANKDYQENAANFAYTGGWQQIPISGASGGKVMQTFNDRGLATFTFRGPQFQLFRVVGPDQGSMEVWVNYTQLDFNDGMGGIQNLENRAAFRAVQGQTILVPGAVNGQWNTVTIRRVADGFAGPIAIDRIVPADLVLKVITAKTDDRDLTKLSYSAGWTPMPSNGAYQNTMNRTTVQNATVQARVKGSTAVIYRNIGPGFGSMNVFVDGAFWGTVDNNAGSDALSVPVNITDLTPVEHVIRLQNNAGSTLEFDAIEGVMSASLGPNKLYDIGDKNIRRSGVWTVQSTTGALAGKTYITNDTTSRLDYNFTGDTFCLAFMRRDDGGTIHIYVDNMNVPHEQISTHTDPDFWGTSFFSPPDTLTGSIQRYCTGAAFPDGMHHVRLLMTSGAPVELDYVFPGRYGIINPRSGLVQENDSRIVHTPWVYSPSGLDSKALWKRITMKSLGGAKAQGGYLKRVTFNPPPPILPVVRFFISGSGFLIYTSSGPLAGGMNILVCEPAAETCSPANIILNGVSQGTFVDLFSLGRPRPFAYAVTGLGPGIHEILIFAEGAGDQYVDFDGVRVFP
jgi:subtilisin family serine protease